MGFTVIDVPQRSEGWMQARLGRLTSSRASDMLATRKNGDASTSRANLRVQLVLERLTGRCAASGYQSLDMQNGADREVEALQHYQDVTGNTVQRTGFLAHDELMAGASLDAHVGAFERVVEVKAPIPATHLEYVRSGKVPLDYARQITHQLWLTGAQAADFVSFNPDFPVRLQLLIVSLPRDEKAIAEHDKAVRAFLAEVETELQALATMTDLVGTLRAVRV
jgi:hypothetical protein